MELIKDNNYNEKKAIKFNNFEQQNENVEKENILIKNDENKINEFEIESKDVKILQNLNSTKKDKIILNNSNAIIEKEKIDLKGNGEFGKNENLIESSQFEDNDKSESDSENELKMKSDILKKKDKKIDESKSESESESESGKNKSFKITNNINNIYNNSHIIYNENNNKNYISNYELTQNIGFINIGHTCYMNSFLQILLHIPTFLPKIKQLYYDKVNENSLIYNLIKLSEYPKDTKYLKEIKKTIAKSYPKYGPFVQNDTQNFAIDFIDSLINEIKKDSSFISESNDQDDNFEITKIEDNIILKKKIYKDFLSDFEKSGEKTFLEDLFLFIESTIRYNGPLIIKKKVRFDLLLNVELTFPADIIKEKYTLYELLDIKYNNFNSILNAEDTIDKIEDYRKEKKNNNCILKYFKSFLETIYIYKLFELCANEKENNEDEKFNKMKKENNNIPKISMNNNIEKSNEISKIVSLPKILIISFTRGIEGKDLISSAISFYEELELKKYIDKDLYNINLGTRYKLFGINIRQGSTKYSGHCYSYVRVKNEWICYNDRDAHKENPNFTLNSVAGLYYIKDN